MTDKKKIFILRLINILLFSVIILFQYNGIFDIKIASANPMLPLALTVACCMFSSELTSIFTGLTVGIFIDSVSSTPIGFNAIVFMLLTLAVSMTAKHLFNNNIFAAVTLGFLSSAVYFIIRWLFCYAFSLSLTESLTYLMRFALPSALYTAIFIIPFYFLEKFLYNKFYFLHNK